MKALDKRIISTNYLQFSAVERVIKDDEREFATTLMVVAIKFITTRESLG
jgi:hypothetical protein